MTTNAKAERVRTRVSLTDTRVHNLRASTALRRVWDSHVPGFHVQITPAGAKSFRVQFQRADGKKVAVTIGSVEAWSVEQARDKARELRRLHESGRDARAYVRAERTSRDLASLVHLWREDYATRLKPSTQASYESILRTIILPDLGSRLVKDISFEDIKRLYNKVRRRTPIQANRAAAVLSKLFTIAEREGLRPDGSNPCRKLEKTRERSRDKVFQASTLAALENGLRTLTEQNRLEESVADLIRFLALSGLRRGEALGLTWTNIDLDRNIMTFTDHKTDRDGSKVLPLNPHLRTILERRAASILSTFVFPGRALDRPFNGLGKVWQRILQASELQGLTPHDLRHTFQTTSMELGYPAAIGDALLGHSLGRIRDTYINLGTDGILAQATRETADWIHAALTGASPRPGVKVPAIAEAEHGSA